MKIVSSVLLGLSLVGAGSTLAAAQQTNSFPKVLQIEREFLKPGKSGVAHDKTESAFVRAMTKSKNPAHYVALNSMSGKSRALYLTQYKSFGEWEADNKLIDKDPALSAEVDRAMVGDGELLESGDSGVFTFDEDLSYKPHPDISSARFMEITMFHLRPGHRDDWYKLAKMVKDAHDKAGTSAHWAMFEAAYGVPDGTYLALSADNSMTDIDTGFADDKKFHDALGDDGMKELRQLFAEAVDTSQSELFSINPRQSYVPDEWLKSDSDFWKPAAAAKPVAKIAEKKP